MFTGHVVGHAGVSPILSQAVLTVLLVVLGLSVVSFALGKTKGVEI